MSDSSGRAPLEFSEDAGALQTLPTADEHGGAGGEMVFMADHRGRGDAFSCSCGSLTCTAGSTCVNTCPGTGLV